MNNKPKLLFTSKSAPLILKAFDKGIDKNGLIIENSTKEPVLTPDNEEININEFGGLKKGSEIFIKDNLYSIMKLAEGKI